MDKPFINTPPYDLAKALKTLSFDDMIKFAEHVGQETGVIGANLTGMVGEELGVLELAHAIRSFADEVNTGDDP